MNRPRVLLADDHPHFLAVVTRLLEADYDVISTVSDGQSAIDEAAKLNPDVLVLDISMPVLNGIETAKQLKAAGFAGKMVFLTVHADADYLHAARTAGAQGYVVKSQLASDLLLTLREVLAGRPFVSPGPVRAECQSNEIGLASIANRPS